MHVIHGGHSSVAAYRDHPRDLEPLGSLHSIGTAVSPFIPHAYDWLNESPCANVKGVTCSC